MEKYFAIPLAMLLSWMGSIEIRLKNRVSKDRFEDAQDWLQKVSDEQVKQGKVLVKVHTIVERMEKNGR